MRISATFTAPGFVDPPEPEPPDPLELPELLEPQAASARAAPMARVGMDYHEVLLSVDPRPNGRELSVDQQPHGSLRQRCPDLYRKFTSCQVPRNKAYSM